MRGRIFQSFVCLLFASVLASPVFAGENQKSFEVYIETNFGSLDLVGLPSSIQRSVRESGKNQPDFANYGAKSLGMVYGGNMFGTGQDKSLLPSKNKTISFIENKYANYAGLLVLDIESWPVQGSDAIVASNVAKYITTLGWVKSAAPGAKVGYYAKPPVPAYSAMQRGTEHKRYKEWQAKNDKLALLADAVDAFFPGCYPNDANQEAWVRKCVGLVSEAKRLGPGKKIYPYINTRYHSQAPDGLAFDLVPQDYFLLQLQTIKQHADGVVIWDWSGTTWNDKDPWWQATLKFLGSK